MFQKIKEITGHAGAVYCSSFDGKFLYTGSADQFVTRWKLNEGIQDSFAIKMSQPVYALAFITPNQLAVGLGNGSIHIFDLEQKQEIKHFTQHIKGVFSITSNNVKNHFYCGDADGNLSIWNSLTLELLLYLPLDCGKIRKIRIAEKGDLMIVACQDTTIRIFETNGYNEITTIKGHAGGTTIADFHPTNADILLSGGKDALLKIWNWKTETLIKEIPAHNYVIYDIQFTEENFITASRDKTIKIWNLENFEFIQRLDTISKGHKHSVNGLQLINNQLFASISDDKKIIIWDNK